MSASHRMVELLLRHYDAREALNWPGIYIDTTFVLRSLEYNMLNVTIFCGYLSLYFCGLALKRKILYSQTLVMYNTVHSKCRPCTINFLHKNRKI